MSSSSRAGSRRSVSSEMVGFSASTTSWDGVSREQLLKALGHNDLSCAICGCFQLLYHVWIDVRKRAFPPPILGCETHSSQPLQLLGQWRAVSSICILGP